MQIPNHVVAICEKINAAGGRGYVVGGAVRDLIRGVSPKDWDVVAVGINSTQLGSAFPDAVPTGKSFPVIRVNDVEIALARVERKIGVGHTAFACETEGVSLEQDLARRDFTMNAMAYHPGLGSLHDPFGGADDIADKLIKHTSAAFSEDPLRVFRAARFAAKLNFRIHPETKELCYRMADSLKSLPAERVLAEMYLAFDCDEPHKFFIRLQAMGVLGVWFPELAALVLRLQPEKHHPEGCVFVHTMLTLLRAKQLGANHAELWAALVHDLGKAVTDSVAPKWQHINHEALGVPLVEQLGNRLKVPAEWIKLGKVAAREHLNIHRFNDLKASTRVDLIGRLRGLESSVGLVAQADAQGRGPTLVDKPYPQRNELLRATGLWHSVHALPEWGPPSPKIGEKLRAARISFFKQNECGN
jgi:tRNA nucleotidyltransferase (CCA-adding enzyme)